MLAVQLAILGVASAAPTKANEPASVARAFYWAYLKTPASGLLVGESRSALSPFLTPRLLRVLDDAKACQDAWTRQQPQGNTDKPPFVDCCLFSSVPDGMPTSSSVGKSESLPDGRSMVIVNFMRKDPPGTYADPAIPLGTIRWRDTLLLQRMEGRYFVDDVLFIDDRPPRTEQLLSESFRSCKDGRFVAP